MPKLPSMYNGWCLYLVSLESQENALKCDSLCPACLPHPVCEENAQVKGFLSLESKGGWNSWKMISQFPVAAVTDNHQFSGLKQCKSIILQFCHSEAWNGSHWAGIKMLAGQATSFSEDSQGESVFFPASGYCPCFLFFHLQPLPPSSKPARWRLSNAAFIVKSLSLTLFCLLLPLVRTFMITLGSPQCEDQLIWSPSSPVIVTWCLHRVQGWGHLGNHFSAYQKC